MSRHGSPRRSRHAAIAHVALVACALLLVACAPRVRAGADTEARPDRGLSPACTAPEASTTPQRLIVHGQERTFLTHLPEAPNAEPHDLVIAFHGRTNDAARARSYFHLDEGRVFVVGHSLGASFANDVACRLGDRIRAVASVAGGLQGGPCVGKTAALILHHPDDPLVPIAEGERVRDAFRAANGLTDARAAPTTLPDLVDLRCVRFGDDAVEDPVVWCRHDDATGPGGRAYAHTWPEGTAAAIAAFVDGLR